MSAIPLSDLSVCDHWQTGFLAVLPAVQTHAQIQFRKLRAQQREEAIQEAIAAACVAYERLAIEGKLHVAYASTLATYAVNHVKGGRHVGARQDAARDVMSPVAHRRHGVQCSSYQHDPPGTVSTGWEAQVVADRKASVPDVAAFRIDFRHWLKSLTRRDQRIIKLFASGEHGLDIAEQLGLSPGRVSQLRRRFEREWWVFQGERREYAA